MVPLLALPLATGAAVALPAAAPAAAASCPEMSFTNQYLGFAMEVPVSNLSQGSTGPCVVMLQQDLNFVIHSGLKVDGDFGPKTLGAVETFQGRNPGCTRGVDGIAGHYTMSCLAAGSG
jgi:peptidoglycan hydrolase-like protein with peptidoglycan-binding domain